MPSVNGLLVLVHAEHCLVLSAQLEWPNPMHITLL